MTTEQIQSELEMLKRRLDDLQSSTTIPLETAKAFGERLKGTTSLNTSAKSASSENQSVNESGSSTYSVLGAPDGFDERLDGSTVKYYPYWL